MIALGIIACALFVIGWFAFGWLNYIGLVLGIIGIVAGCSRRNKPAMVLGIIGTSLCALGSLVMTIAYAIGAF